MGKNIDMKSSEFEKKVDELLEEIKGIPDDPETLKAVEELRRKLGRLTVEDLLEPFTM